MTPRLSALALLATIAFATPACAGPVSDRIYPAPTDALTLAGLPAGAELIEVDTRDGVKLKGLQIAPREGKPVLLIFHGNATSANGAMQWLAPLAAQGYGVVAAEYRGYSANPGKPDEAGLAADADAFYARARTLGAPVWVVGHSLGGGVAMGLARREKLDALFTIGTFTRLRAAAPKIARAFVPDAYRNMDAVAGLDEPWFLIHGTADSVIPASEGSALHAAAGTARVAGQSYVIQGADHWLEEADVAAIVTNAARRLETGKADAEGLRKEIKLVPFGQSAPINP